MRLTESDIEITLGRAINSRMLRRAEDSAILFYDLTWLQQRFVALADLFPPSTLHAVAIKANPLVKVLHKLNRWGAGFETASLPELCLAQKAGANASHIVFDSPAKTTQELEYTLQSGVHLNADSLDEVARIAALLQENPSHGTIGVRINPQVGTGAIAALSVAGEYSKFGVPIKSRREELLAAYLEHEWLTAVHLHVGSQGCPLDLIIRGIERVLDFAEEVNARLAESGSTRRITTFDLGGGVPVSYYPETQAPTMAEYAARLRARCPSLFDGRFRLITEFGRWLFTHSGWTVSRVEYVKRETGINTAIVHVGADLLLRLCYRPDEWHHEFIAADAAGRIKRGEAGQYNIAGPLCFAGDMLAREISLPRLEEKDYLIIQDTGAYTLSMWSRYNSRQMPRVIGYTHNGDRFEVLRERESPADLIQFWS